MQSANDSSPDDVPTPEEIDPSLLVDPNCCDLIDCDRCGYLDVYGAVRAM